MARAVGNTGSVAYPEQALDVTTLDELANRLERLGKAQEAARALVLGDDPDYATAFGQLFVTVALLNPAYAAAEIQKLVRSPMMRVACANLAV